jgi:hypothetical protein
MKALKFHIHISLNDGTATELKYAGSNSSDFAALIDPDGVISL